MRARGTGREGSALPASRDAGPMPSPEIGAGVCIVSAADEDAFRTAACLRRLHFLRPRPCRRRSRRQLPGLGPSGEIETRAERFPAGIAGGATGAGVAESAMSVSRFAGASADVWSRCVRFRFLRGRARRGHWIHRKQRFCRGLRGRSDVDRAGLLFQRRNFRRGEHSRPRATRESSAAGTLAPLQ